MYQTENIEQMADELGIDGGDSSHQADRLRKIAEQVGMAEYNSLYDNNELENKLKELKEKRKQEEQQKQEQKQRETQRKKNQNNNNNSSKDEKTKVTIKFPKKIKIIFYSIIIVVVLIFLMLFIVLFGYEASGSGGGAAGSYALGKTCTNVTVTNTENYINDGEVAYETYLAGVVAAEAGEVDNLDYYKVVAIAARTYISKNINSNCEVEGNENFKKYMNVEDNAYSELIKQALSETKNLVLTQDKELTNVRFSYGNIQSEDDSNYYVNFGYDDNDSIKTITVPKSWADSSIFKDYLATWDTSGINNESSTDFSLIGVLYLISNEGYNYQTVITNYYGEKVEITENQMILVGNEGFMNPTRKLHCSCAYGDRIHPVTGAESFHSGVDIAISGGEPIYAAKDGTITTVVKNVTAINTCSYGYGNYIVIDHGNGQTTLYAHIKYGTIPDYIEKDATVTQGTEIGQIGSTGCSTGNHLHYEVRENGKYMNPSDYLNLEGATGSCTKGC